MRRHRPEVADVFRSHGAAFERSQGGSIAAEQRRVLRELAICRTPALGGHRFRCDRCGYERVAYHSCRNRHCPKCQAHARARWLDDRRRELLPVPYFHVVFTVPERIGPLALQNKRQVYGILFRSVAETLQTLARDPRHLGAEIGFMAILHTWGQTLQHHPHLHCVVPGGGIGPDGQSWVSSRANFFLPVRVMSRVFRGKFLDHLQQAFRRGELAFHGRLTDLAQDAAWARWMRRVRSASWVVYAKPPFGGPQQVLKYLARYTHRVAISNHRLESFDQGEVRFRWKDYARGNRQRVMTVDAVEFIRRFLLHVLPRGFVRIRHYGFLANRDRRHHIEVIRDLAGQRPTTDSVETLLAGSIATDPDPGRYCPRCQRGRLLIIELILPPTDHLARSPPADTSSGAVR